MQWYKTIKAKCAFFYAMTALVLAMVYSGCMVYIQLNTEKQLMSSTMDSMLMGVVDRDLRYGQRPILDSLSTLYIQDDSITPIPEPFKQLPDGYSEYTESEELHVYAKTIDGKRYILTRLQEDFENWEHQQFQKGMILLGVVFLVTFGIGYWVIRRIFIPLDRLMTETRSLDRRLREGILDDNAFKGEWGKNEVGELASSFQSLTQRLEHLWEGERRFASEVSHELRTPMTVIGMSIELLENAPNLTDHQKDIIQRAKRTSIRMNELLEVFLNISRRGVGKTSRIARVSDIVEEMLPTWQNEASAKGLALVYSNVTELQWRIGEDFTKLGKKLTKDKHYNAVLVAVIFNNLVVNAIRYTDKGTVTITLDMDKFLIEDTGGGIASQDQEHIFDIGYRGAVMENSDKVGFGLGLAIAMRACAILGWHITVDSTEGKGTVFTIFTENRQN